MNKINYETHILGARLDETLGARARRPNFASSIDSGIRKSVNSDLDSCHSSEVSCERDHRTQSRHLSHCRLRMRWTPQVWFLNGFPTAETERGSGAEEWLCSPTWASPALRPAPGPTEITQTRTARSAGRESLSKYHIKMGNHFKCSTRSVLTIYVSNKNVLCFTV